MSFFKKFTKFAIPKVMFMTEFFFINNPGEWFFSVAYILIFILNIIFVIVIISENRNPVRSIAWITVLTMIPIVGFIFYLFFGREQRSQKMISRKGKRKLQRLVTNNISINEKEISSLSPSIIQQLVLGNRLTGAMVTLNNGITVYTSGKDKFNDLFNDIKNAKSFIHLQYYIIEDDTIGRELKKLLIEKALQGIEIRVLYDDVGCWSWREKKFFKEMTDAGIEAKPFFKVTFPQLANKLNYRNHRKIAIIDGITGYIGGMNIADRYIDGGKFGKWRDTHIRIKGEAVNELQSIFLVDWNFTTKELLSKQSYFPKINKQEKGATIQLLTSGPLDEHKAIALTFLKMISAAKKRIYLQTPYFLPNSEMSKALKIAALSGVDVRVMIPERSDSKLLQYATNSYITEMLKAGIKIYMYKGGFLHSKSLLIDNEITSIGSTNFDLRSFEQNFEINAFIFDKDFNEENANIFMQDIKSSVKITLKSWSKRSFFSKIHESLSRLFSPVL